MKAPVEARRIKWVHHVTLCMVPPPEAVSTWESVTEMRKRWKDPGFFRWPPHANLLYPFPDIGEDAGDTKRVLDQLHSCAQSHSPFKVRLSRLGTFGGNKRGVLWLHPESFPVGEQDDKPSGEGEMLAPLIALQQSLTQSLSSEDEKGNPHLFTPHMTLSHFENQQDAEAAKEVMDKDDLPSMEFLVDRVYILRRNGDDGQFQRLAEIGLGPDSSIQQFDHPLAFPNMPQEEEEWVHEERIRLKRRRKKGSNRRKGKSS